MTADNSNQNQSLLYGGVGFIVGAVVASLIVYNLTSQPSSPVSSTPDSTSSSAKLVNSSTAPATSPSEMVPGRLGMMTRSDQHFIVMMIPHHQMAIMMSTMVVNSADHPEIRTLAQSITRSQSAEIEHMQQWYQTWYPNG